MHFYIFLIFNSFASSVSPLIAMGWPCYMVRMWMILKVDFRSKLKKSTNSSCFIVTMYLGNNAHVEYVDNWTWSYSLVSIYAKIIKNNIQGVSHKRLLVLAGNLKVGKPLLYCFFFQTQHRLLHKKHFYNICMLIFLNICLGKLIGNKRATLNDNKYVS